LGIYVCTCICMYVRRCLGIYVCTCGDVWVYMYVRVYVSTCICVYVWICLGIYVCTWGDVWVYMCVREEMFGYIYVYVEMFGYICVYVRRCLGIVVCTCIDFTTISTIFQLDVGTLLIVLYFVLVSFFMLSGSWNDIMVQYSYSFTCRFVLKLKTNLCQRSARDIQSWDKGWRAMFVIKYFKYFCLY